MATKTLKIILFVVLNICTQSLRFNSGSSREQKFLFPTFRQRRCWN